MPKFGVSLLSLSCIAAFGLASVASQSPAMMHFRTNSNLMSEQTSSNDLDWTLGCQSVSVKSYCDPELNLTPVVEAKITFCAPTALLPTRYEDLWYATAPQSLCVGASRHNSLSIPRGHLVSINLCKDCDVLPSAAQADLIARLILDVQINDNWIDSVIVADDSFDEVESQLGIYNIVSADSVQPLGNKAFFAFNLQSKSGQRATVMEYSAPTAIN